MRGTTMSSISRPELLGGEGVLHMDLSLFKNFSLGEDESRWRQFRAEVYNAFNHTI